MNNVILTIVGFLLIFAILLCYVSIPQMIIAASDRKPALKSTKNANWMETLSDEIKNKPLNTLSLPGTHDSGSSKIIFDIKPDINPPQTTSASTQQASGAFNTVDKLTFLPPVKSLMNNWTLTQNLSIGDQLILGIRVFDLRIMYHENQFWLSHTFICQPADEVFEQINTFIAKHPSEVIVLIFSFDYEARASVDETVQTLFTNNLRHVFNEKLIHPQTDVLHRSSFPTINDVIKTKGRIITFLQPVVPFSKSDSPKFLWDYNKVYAPWLNTSDVNEKLYGLETNVANFKDPGKYNFNVLLITLTPQNSDIIKGVLVPFGPHSKSTFEFAQQIQSQLPAFISQNKHVIGKVSAFLTDFPDQKFVEMIISLNKNSRA